MDDTLKRRLVGALVLLTAAFAFATLLPAPGPRAPGEAHHAAIYDLRTGERLDGGPAPASAAAPAATPPPVTAAPAAAAARAPSTTVPASADVKEPAAAAREAEPGGWYVQVGSFGTEDHAKLALQHLYSGGLPARLQAVEVGKAYWYRVRIGPYEREEQARAVLAALAKQDYRGARVMHADAGP